LGASDEQPVDWINQHVESTIALVCEHAGNAVPESLDNLGLSDEQLSSHSAMDIGAAETARHIAVSLTAPLLMQRYSRLVIDCNRPPEAPDSIPENSHGTQAPGNQNLSDKERAQRIDEIFTPYDQALSAMLEAPARLYAFSIHSFTPVLNDSRRPWDIGFLFRHDTRTSASLADYLNSTHPQLNVGLNQPYQIDDESDWFVPKHAERLGLNHSLIEIRNDLIDNEAGQRRLAGIIAAAINHISL
jgi:predicted N-formylglutamate amidohydrolase